MNLQQFAERFEAVVRAAIEDVAKAAAEELRNTTPAKRAKTRDAVYHKTRGLQAEVGLRFAKRYPGTNTATHRRLAIQWQRMRAKLRARLIHRINAGLHN